MIFNMYTARRKRGRIVLILGKYDGAAFCRLKRIASKLEELGYYTYIVKEQPARLGESFVQKVVRYALSSRFVIIEDSEPSGHLGLPPENSSEMSDRV